jgi:hypothetical protein|tara:strand:- start:768 stop:929 length:162 start_codon:yes stop_codon:yes gene_type:complete
MRRSESLGYDYGSIIAAGREQVFKGVAMHSNHRPIKIGIRAMSGENGGANTLG